MNQYNKIIIRKLRSERKVLWGCLLISWGVLLVGCGSSEPEEWSQGTEIAFADSCGAQFNYDISSVPYCVCIASELEKRFSEKEMMDMISRDLTEEEQKEVTEAGEKCQELRP